MRRSRKRRTTPVEVGPRSPRPNTCAGQTITTGSPRAATRSASVSAAALDSAYGTPSPGGNALRSSTAPCGFAGPTAPIEDVCTTRSTPARSASSITIRVPSTFTRSSSAGDARRCVVPATWNTRSTPRSARRSATRSPSCATDTSTSSPAIASREELGAQRDAHVVAALDERAGHMGAHEARRTGDQRRSHPRRIIAPK